MVGLLALLPLAQAPQIMSYEEYGKVNHSRPYVLRIQSETATIVYFGIGHTRDPEDKQLQIAERLWRDLKPQAAFHEDYSPKSLATLAETVRLGGEPAWVAFMSKADGIPFASLDPGRVPESDFLAQKFGVADVKSMFVLRNIHEYLKRPVGARTNSVEKVANANLMRLALTTNLKGKPNSAEELQEALVLVAGTDAKIGEPRSDWFDPGVPKVKTRYHEIARASSQFRDRHMVGEIAKLATGNTRAFIVMGASHVVMQGPAIRTALPKAKIEILTGR